MAKMIYTQEEKNYMAEAFGTSLDGTCAYDSKVKEYRKAKELGLTVQEWQEKQRNANKKAALEAKIQRYERALQEMKKELEKLREA